MVVDIIQERWGGRLGSVWEEMGRNNDGVKDE